MKYRQTKEMRTGTRLQRAKQRLRLVMEMMEMWNWTETDSLPRRKLG
jgi:hypothetical protein